MASVDVGLSVVNQKFDKKPSTFADFNDFGFTFNGFDNGLRGLVPQGIKESRGTMSSTITATGSVVQLNAQMLASTGLGMTGATVSVVIRRTSDNKYLDFSSHTFKSSGWTTASVAMTEVSAAMEPGVYVYNLDLSTLSGLVAHDTYWFCATAPGASAPFRGSVQVSTVVDNLDEAITALSTTIGNDFADIKGVGWANGNDLVGIFNEVLNVESILSNVEDQISGVPDLVWTFDISANLTKAQAGGALTIVRMLSTNRLEESPGVPGLLHLYRDDGTTLFLTYTLRDYNNLGTVGTTGQPARRSAGA